MQLMSKPPLPGRLFDSWERIPVDTEATPFREIRSCAVGAATDWALGDNGPYKQPGMTLAQVVHGAVEEALLFLLEMGVIDIDEARIAKVVGWPSNRRGLAAPAESADPNLT